MGKDFILLFFYHVRELPALRLRFRKGRVSTHIGDKDAQNDNLGDENVAMSSSDCSVCLFRR
jgi:hypothetical protein